MIEIRHESINEVADEIHAYNTIYRTSGIRHLDSLYLWIINLLNAKSGQTVLDVSSGECSVVHLAQRRGLHAFGADFSEMALRKGVVDYGVRTAFVANAECLPVANCCFDFVTNIGSVEHYFHPETALHEMGRVLKPGGVACILLPNGFSIFGNVKYVWQHGDVFDDGQPLQRYNTHKGWYQLLVANGLQPFKTLKYERERPLTRADLMWYLKRPAKLLKLMISPLVPVNLANSIVYLCHPVKTAQGSVVYRHAEENTISSA